MRVPVVVLLAVLVCTAAAISTNTCKHALCGCKVIRAQITTEAQIALIEDMQMDVWSHASKAHIGTNDIMVCKEDLALLQGVSGGVGALQYEVMVEDVLQSVHDAHTDNLELKNSADWFAAYHTLDEIVTKSQEFAKTYPTLLTVTPSAGKSVENRDIAVWTITNGQGAKNRPKLLLLGGQHAREWIGPATLLYIANKLLSGYGTDKVVTPLLDNFDIVIVPVLNADGYTYTWTSTTARLWRKNRRHNSDGSYGVDLNRNWGFHWCESGASKKPSDDTFCGTGPFSEPETQAIQNISSVFGPFSGAIDFHSYGQLLMRPYGYTNQPPPNNDELKRVGDGMRDTMKAATGVSYTSQAIWQLYLSAGSSADYWTSINITYSYGFEARDTGKYGFLLPADQIQPSGEENFAAVNYLAAQIKK